MRIPSLPWVVVALAWSSTEAFTSISTSPRRALPKPLLAIIPKDNPEGKQSPQRLPKWMTPVALGLLSAISMDKGPMLLNFRPKAALASAPLMAPKRQELIDPEAEAMYDLQRKVQKKTEQELKEYHAKAREIGETKGEAARAQFEKEWEAERLHRATEKAKGLEKLRRELLDEGICPFVDPEGRRQVIKYEKGIDLAEVLGTREFLEKSLQQSNYKRSLKYQKQAHRFIIKCMVEDMKKKNIDPLPYFKENQDKTAEILNMITSKAILIAEQYSDNMEKYGQLTPPKEGEEIPQLKKEEPLADKKAAAAAAKAELKAAAQKAKAEAKEAAQKVKAEMKAKAAEMKAKAAEAKAKLKEEARLAKEAAESKLSDAKAAAAAAAASAAQTVEQGVDAAEQSVEDLASTMSDGLEDLEGGLDEGLEAASETTTVVTKTATKRFDNLPILPTAAFVVAAGGGGIAFKLLREKAEVDEEERKRQYKLIMGLTDDDDEEEQDDDDEDYDIPLEIDEPEYEDIPVSKAPETKTPETKAPVSKPSEPIPELPKKKKRGLKSMFGKKNANQRETDLSVLVSEDATAPELALLLAKLLTFGAPGRFPQVTALPGNMPMESFDLEAAKDILVEATSNAGISKVDAAEIFANVVNCMLIDIVDLASSTLKEKEKVTVDAINVVVDFMNHAASLYDSIAEDVVITPVTYGGSLAKSKLEQMYSTYAVSGMMSMDEEFTARVGLLQDVFSISEKKAEGLMMKAMQKNMAKMMKDGEGMEGMEDMMKAMGGDMGLGGMPGMEGEDGPSPEQLKEMLLTLKTMKDSGTIPPDELEAVRAQFSEAFGSSIEEVMGDADKDKESLSQTDKELLDLMKSILDD